MSPNPHPSGHRGRRLITAAMSIAAALVTVLAGAGGVSRAATPSTITLCTGTALSGKCASFPVGAAPTVDPVKFGFGAVTSVLVPAGLLVRLYASPRFSGASALVVGHNLPVQINDLRANNGNLLGSLPYGTVGSFDVESSKSLATVVCSDPNLKGSCAGFYGAQDSVTDSNDLRNSIVGDDTVSSVWVLDSWLVNFYSDPNLTGDVGVIQGNGYGRPEHVVKDLRQPDPTVGGTLHNDTASSLRIIALDSLQ